MTNGLNSSSAISLGRPHWCSLQRRAGDDDRTAGVVDALAEQVLAEPALLALQHVGQRLQRAVARPGDRAAAAAVVEQRVDGLLQHALLVVDDDLGRAEVEQPLQAVVAVDHAAVQVVEVDVAKRPPSSWTIGRSSGGITGTTSRIIAFGSLSRRPWSSRWLNEATILRRLMAFCLRWADSGLRPLAVVVDRLAQLDLLLVEVDAVDQRLDRVGAGAALEVVAVAVAQLAPQHLVVDDLAAVQALELVPRALRAGRAPSRSARGSLAISLSSGVLRALRRCRRLRPRRCSASSSSSLIAAVDGQLELLA